MRRKIGCCCSCKKQLLFVVFGVVVGFGFLILNYYDEFASSSHLTKLQSVYVSISHGDVRSLHACLRPSRGAACLSSGRGTPPLAGRRSLHRRGGAPATCLTAPATCCQLSPSVPQQEQQISVSGFKGPNLMALAGRLQRWLHHWLSIRAGIHQVLCHQTRHDPTNGDGEQPPERSTAEGEREEFTGTLNSVCLSTIFCRGQCTFGPKKRMIFVKSYCRTLHIKVQCVPCVQTEPGPLP